MSTKIIDRTILTGGCVRPGVFLQTAQEIIFDQLSWDDGDESKHTDFSTSTFWVTTDDGQVPIGIDTDDDLASVV